MEAVLGIRQPASQLAAYFNLVHNFALYPAPTFRSASTAIVQGFVSGLVEHGAKHHLACQGPLRGDCRSAVGGTAKTAKPRQSKRRRLRSK